MKKIAFAAALFMSSNALCQTAASPQERETLLALLAEVHQLRSSIEAMTVASQRAQIALYALQMQDPYCNSRFATAGRSSEQVQSARRTKAEYGGGASKC